jgi:hypothetical protein
MSEQNEEFIGRVDVRELKSGIRWMITRLLSPRFAEEVELGRYMRELLKTQRWSVVRVVPHTDERSVPSPHVFDVYGVVATGVATFSPEGGT